MLLDQFYREKVKKWVFHSIFRLAFLSLYGEHLCSMNRLVLTDEEDVSYHAFETMIATHDAFCSSKVMLCTFHAVWQPFCMRAWEYLYQGSYYLDQGNVILMVFSNTYMMGLLRRIISWLCQWKCQIAQSHFPNFSQQNIT